jgi:cyclophilin family peptidyl-prolyl cis-trans isomerase
MKTVLLTTSLGNITLELDDAKAPITVANFCKYIEDGFYNGTIFHRIIPGFMIQGGGFTADMSEKPTKNPIEHE